MDNIASVVITRCHLEEAIAKGACKESISRIKEGCSLFSLPFDDLLWIELSMPEKCKATGSVPISLYARSGSGYGSGYGYGSGDGSGSGYGYGSGDGSGDGYGYGDGD